MLKKITGIDYPIYSYNSKQGRLNKIELTNELEQQTIESLNTTQVFYWPDEYEEPVIYDIGNKKMYTK